MEDTQIGDSLPIGRIWSRVGWTLLHEVCRDFIVWCQTSNIMLQGILEPGGVVGP